MQNQDEAPGNVQSLSRNAFVGFARKSSTPASLSLSDVLAAYPREAEDETALLGVLEEKKLRKRLLRSIILPNIEDMNGDMANANAFGGPENLVLQLLSNLLSTFSAFVVCPLLSSKRNFGDLLILMKEQRRELKIKLHIATFCPRTGIRILSFATKRKIINQSSLFWDY